MQNGEQIVAVVEKCQFERTVEAEAGEIGGSGQQSHHFELGGSSSGPDRGECAVKAVAKVRLKVDGGG